MAAAAGLHTLGGSRPEATTACPSAARRSVMARPIPNVPPVTMTTRDALTCRPPTSDHATIAFGAASRPTGDVAYSRPRGSDRARQGAGGGLFWTGHGQGSVA